MKRFTTGITRSYRRHVYGHWDENDPQFDPLTWLFWVFLAVCGLCLLIDWINRQ